MTRSLCVITEECRAYCYCSVKTRIVLKGTRIIKAAMSCKYDISRHWALQITCTYTTTYHAVICSVFELLSV